MPDGQDLRALIDALETLFGFRDSCNRGNPELVSARSVESHANALPAILNAERRARDNAAEAQVLWTGRSLKKTIRLCGREEIQYGLDSYGKWAIESGGNRDFHFTRNFAAARRRTKRKQLRDREARTGVVFPMPGERSFAHQLGLTLGGAAGAKRAARETGIF